MAHSRSFALCHAARPALAGNMHGFQPWWDGSVARGETEPVREAQRSADTLDARLTIDELIQRCEGMEAS